MEERKSCILSYVLDGAGGGQAADLAALTPEDASVVWLHLNGQHPEAGKFLKDHLHLDPLVIRALLAEETRPRLEISGTGTLIILRGIHFNPGPTPEDLVSIRLWVTGNRIISVGRRKSRTIADIDMRLRQGYGPRRAGEFVTQLCSSLNEGIAPALLELEKNIDTLEEKSLENPDAALRSDIAAVRKQATLFRRHMSPQREVVSRLQQMVQDWFAAVDRWQMQDNHDQVTRYIEDIDAIRERTQILQDELASALSARLNKNLYILSVITVIFMPLSFMSGLLGMNVRGIPGAENPFAFYIICTLAAVMTLLQIFVFRRLKWL